MSILALPLNKEKLYLGNYRPVSMYQGDRKIAGWTWAEKQGAAVEFEDTYNDAVHGVISGHSEQAVTVQGKNLFDINKEFGSEWAQTANPGEYVSTQDAPWIYSNVRYMEHMFLPDTQYTLTQTIKNPAGNNVRLQFRYTDGTASGSVISTGEYIASSFTSTAGKTVSYLRLTYSSYGEAGTVYIKDIQIELGSTATAYEPFVPNSPSPDYPSPIHSAGGCDLKSESADGSKSSSIAMPTLRSLPNGVKDTLTYNGGGMWEHVQGVGRIASYSGESITGAYMSTTGALSVGAEVVYELAEPITTMLNLGELNTYPHETQIHQDTTGLLADLNLTARVVDKEAE